MKQICLSYGFCRLQHLQHSWMDLELELMQKTGKDGVYFLPDYLRAAVVVIHQLPQTQDTLWLKILGKGTVQKEAINELRALPVYQPLRSNALLLLTNLQANLRAKENLDEEDRDLIMELSPLVKQWQSEATQQGILSERRATIENLLKIRFGSVNAQLSAIIQPIVELSSEELARLLLQLFNLSREELLARFGRS